MDHEVAIEGQRVERQRLESPRKTTIARNNQEKNENTIMKAFMEARYRINSGFSSKRPGSREEQSKGARGSTKAQLRRK
jgi:hypothetical protein